jgi:hypothetical protein
MPEANMDMPALSADESTQSSGNMTDTSISEHQPQTLPISSQPIKNFTQPLSPNNLQLQQLQLQLQQQEQIQQQQPAFMDQSFFYGLDQLTSENPLFFMQQQQHQQQQQQQQQIQQHQHHLQQQPTSLYQNQFLKKATVDENADSSSSITNENGGPMNNSSTTLAQSITTSMESFQAAVTTSVGEQPPTFWTGLNNVCIFNCIIYRHVKIVLIMINYNLVYFKCNAQQYISNISQHCSQLSRIFS